MTVTDVDCVDVVLLIDDASTVFIPAMILRKRLLSAPTSWCMMMIIAVLLALSFGTVRGAYDTAADVDAAPALIYITPPMLQFGDTQVHTSAEVQQFLVSNTGTQPVWLSVQKVEEPTATSNANSNGGRDYEENFHIIGDTGTEAPLLVGGFRHIYVSFVPHVLGPLAATLRFYIQYSNASTSPAIQILQPSGVGGMYGRGMSVDDMAQQPALVMTNVSRLVFRGHAAAVPVADQYVQLWNPSDVDAVRIPSASWWPLNSPFDILNESTLFPLTLEPGESQTLEIQFTPAYQQQCLGVTTACIATVIHFTAVRVTSASTATPTVVTDDPYNYTATVSCSGYWFHPVMESVTQPNPTNISFGLAPYLSPSTLQLYSRLRLHAGDVYVAAGSSLPRQSRSITFGNWAGSDGLVSISALLLGADTEGSASVQMHAQQQHVAVGDDEDEGDRTADLAAFTLWNDTAETRLGIDRYRSMRWQFLPSAVGHFSASFAVVSSSPSVPVLRFAFTADAEWAHVSLSPSQLAFGAVETDESAVLDVSIINSGRVDLFVLRVDVNVSCGGDGVHVSVSDSATMQAAPVGLFSIVQDSGEQQLSPGMTDVRHVSVQFSPAAVPSIATTTIAEPQTYVACLQVMSAAEESTSTVWMTATVTPDTSGKTGWLTVMIGVGVFLLIAGAVGVWFCIRRPARRSVSAATLLASNGYLPASSSSSPSSSTATTTVATFSASSASAFSASTSAGSLMSSSTSSSTSSADGADGGGGTGIAAVPLLATAVGQQ